MKKYTYSRTADGRLKKVKRVLNVELDEIERKFNDLRREISINNPLYERIYPKRLKTKNRENFHTLFEKIMKEKGIKVYTNGYPDYVIESKSKLIFVEVKNPKEKLNENQREIRELFHKYGLRYFVYRGEEEIIKRILDEE